MKTLMADKLAKEKMKVYCLYVVCCVLCVIISGVNEGADCRQVGKEEGESVLCVCCVLRVLRVCI